jgi:ACS family hexuronate transporter-like MFS transporter
MMAYALGAVPLGFVLYGASIHLGRGLGYDQTTIGRVLWVPPLGWEVGYFFWGAVLDRASRRGPLPPRAYARLFALLALLSLPVVAAPFSSRLPVVLALLFFAMFVASGFVIASLAETTRRHGLAHSAYLAGLGAGSWSGVMALVMPIFGFLFDRRAFGAAYALAAVFPLCAAVGWRLMSGRDHRAPSSS